MILLGLVLLIVGLLVPKLAILVTIGAILLIVGLVLLALHATGHGVGAHLQATDQPGRASQPRGVTQG